MDDRMNENATPKVEINKSEVIQYLFDIILHVMTLGLFAVSTVLIILLIDQIILGFRYYIRNRDTWWNNDEK